MQQNRKIFSTILVVTFLLMSICSTSAWAASFSDVSGSHWAIQQLDRMSARGVIQGYEDGTARPNNPVTQFEAIIMAVKVMGLDSKMSSVAKGTYLPISYPAWSGAYEYAVVAYQNGLIDSNDFDYKASASRQWVTKLLIKVMGKENSVGSAAGEYLPYSDTSAIGTEYLNYVKLANSMGLISGYTDGTFQPKNTVTRAEMVTFLTKAENRMEVTASNVIIGEIASISGVNVGITATNGSMYNLYATTNSTLYDAAGNKIGVTGLKVGDKIYAIYTNSLLNYLEINDNLTVSGTNISGTITSILNDKKTLVVTDNDDALNTVIVDNQTKITRDSGTVALNFSDLSINDYVQVTLDKDQTASKIVVITSKSAQVSGTIYSVDVLNNLIIIDEKDGLTTYKMSKTIEVSIAGMLTATTSSLKEGDMATYTIMDGVMTAIAVAGTSDNFGGNATITAIDTTNKIINYTNTAGELRASYYNAGTSITFEDDENGTISELQVGDSVTLTVTNNKITSIVVKNRKSTEGTQGTVYAIDRTNYVITLVDNNGIKTTYDISPNVKVTLYGETSNLNAVNKDMKVEITVVNNKITKIKASDRIEGTVTDVNRSKSTISIKSDGVTTTYDVSSSLTVYSYNSTSYRLSAVNEGDEVSMKVVDDEVRAIYIKTEQDFTVTALNSSTSLKVTDSSGNTRYLYIADVDFTIDGVSNNNISSLSIGDALIGTYEGNTLVALSSSRSVSGEITSVNVNTNVVTIKGFGSSSSTVTFSNNSYVVKNGSNFNSITSLSVGDRVIVSSNASTGRCFTVLESKTGSLQYATAGILKFLDSNTLYKPINGCYTHRANSTTQIGLTSLNRNDSVTIYYTSDNAVYEVIRN